MTVLRFAGFTLDTANRELRRGGALVPAEPKVLECVELLVRKAGQLVTREELRRALWPDVTVGGDAMRQVIYGARKALGDRGASPALIRNRKRLGYVFTGEVARSEPRRLWPFVGREHELETLREVTAAARNGRGAVCLVAGEAGAGKSALVSRLRETASEEEAACRVGHCQPGSGVPAFWPFREMARTDPAFPDPCALAVAGGAMDAEQRFLACDAFVSQLRELSHERPLFLILEDLHWADDGTLLLFEWLARAARDSAMSVVGTYRPDEVAAGTSLAKVIGRVSGREGAVEVTLASLTTDELLKLLSELSHPAATRRGAEALREMTGGNALFVRQVMQQASVRNSALPSALSGGLRHVVLERAARLPIETQRALGMASVVGRDFSLSTLSVVANAAPEDVLRSIQPALVAGILEFAGDELRFSHALLRDAMYDALKPAEKQAHHARALSAWTTVSPGAARTAAMATHAFQAGDAVPQEHRLAWCEQAGREAFAALAFDHAAVHLERALQLSDVNPPSETTAELALLAARALWEADAASELTARAFQKAASLARLSRSPHVLAQAAIGCAVGEESVATLANARWKPENLALLEEAFAALTAPDGEAPSPSHVAIEHRLARVLSAVRGAAGDHAGAHAAAGLARAHFPPDDEPWARLQHLFVSFTDGLWLSGSESGEAVIPALIAQAKHPGLRAWQRVEACAMRLSASLLRGDAGAHRDALEELERLLATLPQPPPFGRSGDRFAIYRAVHDLAVVTTAIFEGRFADAERSLRAIGPHGAPVPREIQEPASSLSLQLLGYQGRAATLEPDVDRRLREYPDDVWNLSIAKAQILVERGAVDEALEYYDVVRRTGFCVPYNGRLARAKPEARWRMIELCAAIGDAADAAVLYEGRARGSHYFIIDGVLVNLGSSSRPMGELAEKLGRFDDAEALFRQAVAMNGQMGHRPEVIRSQLCLARALQRRARHREARPLLARCRAEAMEMGMTPMVTLAEQLAARPSP